jgi:hypothetical protein
MIEVAGLADLTQRAIEAIGIFGIENTQDRTGGERKEGGPEALIVVEGGEIALEMLKLGASTM